MRKRLTAVGLGVALFAHVLGVSAQGREVTSDQQTLIALEKNWNEAVYRKDLALIGSFLADEFVGSYPDGSRGDRAHELSMVQEFNQQVDSAIQDEFAVRVYGDTAIVWFTLHLVGPKQGKATAVDMRYVDVFIWRDGRWQCVSSHSTRVAQ